MDYFTHCWGIDQGVGKTGTGMEDVTRCDGTIPLHIVPKFYFAGLLEDTNALFWNKGQRIANSNLKLDCLVIRSYRSKQTS